MRVVVYEFMSLDGVVQAPGGPDEDRDGGFDHGGWSAPYFDQRPDSCHSSAGWTTGINSSIAPARFISSRTIDSTL